MLLFSPGGVHAAEVPAPPLVPERILLQHDDGSMEARRRLEGRGQALRFDRPAGGPWFLTSVSFFGWAYGMRPVPQEAQWFPTLLGWNPELEGPAEGFTVYLCDGEFRLLKEFWRPYWVLGGGPERWHTINLEPTEVPERFWVVWDFGSTAERGVWMGVDGNGKEALSREGIPGKPWRKMEAPFNWMIRAGVGKAGLGAMGDEPKPGEVRVNPKDGAEMVWIPGGEFWMGNDPEEIDEICRRFVHLKDVTVYEVYKVGEKVPWEQRAQCESPKHRVRVDGFWMYRCEVTVAQYRKFCQVTGQEMPGQPDWSKDDHPVVNVNWDDAQAYCKWAGGQLPTEAQWEYAVRGGTRYVFPWGNDLPGPGDRVCNMADQTAKKKYPDWSVFPGYDDGYAESAPVGSYAPNPFGVYDLAGNVEEWCADWYDEQYYAQCAMQGIVNNPQGPADGTWRVIRGGSWNFNPLDVRPGDRRWGDPRSNQGGFRVVSSRP